MTERLPPKITIITAVLNAENTVEGAFKSVLMQNYPNLEYIVIDGGSTDGTLSIIEKYREHFSHVVSEPDHGIYDAFNKGLRLATGEIIGILNADDQYAPWALGVVAKAYVENSNFGVFYGRQILVDVANGEWLLYPAGTHTKLLDHMSIFHHASFITKPAYDKNGLYDATFRIAADWDLLIRFYSQGEKFYSLEVVLTAFRNTGISSEKPNLCAWECCRVYGRYLNWKQAYVKCLFLFCLCMKLKLRELLVAMRIYQPRRCFQKMWQSFPKNRDANDFSSIWIDSVPTKLNSL